MSLGSIDPQRLLRAALRRDFVAFIEKVFATVSPGQPYLPNWHVETNAAVLSRGTKGASMPAIDRGDDQNPLGPRAGASATQGRAFGCVTLKAGCGRACTDTP